MDSAAFPELAALSTLVKRARLAPDAKHTALWCLGQLPKLYADFCRTHESRFGDAISRLAQAVLKNLAGQGTGRVGDAFLAQLAALHERLGLAPLALKPTAAPRSGRKKKSV
jgi:hypothetical protein